MNLSNFGSKLKISRNLESQEKDIFIGMITTFEQSWIRTNTLYDQLGIDFYNYEENYYNVIEDLIYLKYGDDLGSLILWFVYDRYDLEGNLQSIEITFPGKKPKMVKLKTAEDLWNLIEKINKAENNG
jgi:hypothetical protein